MRGREAVARRYAKAIFSLAKEQERAEPIAGELETVARVFEENGGITEFLGRPWHSGAAKREAVMAIAGGLELSRLTRDFAVLLAVRGRVDHLPEIVAAYGELVDADLGRVRARVRAAVPLTAGERDALAARLAAGLGAAQVVLEEAVDRTLLGGFVAQVGSVVLDGSLDGQLARVRERLARGQE